MINDYTEYAEEGDWDETNTPLPTLLLVCDRKELPDKVIRAIESVSDDIDEELEIRITSMDELAADPKRALWRNVFD